MSRGVVLATLLCTAAAAVAAQAPALRFRLVDQFDAEHGSEQLAGQVVLVIASDRSAQELNRTWGDALRQALAPEIGAGAVAVVPVAHLKGVPGPMRKGVRSRFPEDSQRWVLLDWNGEFDAAYVLEPAVSNVLIFGRHGTLATRVAAAGFHEAQLQHLVALARSLASE